MKTRSPTLWIAGALLALGTVALVGLQAWQPTATATPPPAPPATATALPTPEGALTTLPSFTLNDIDGNKRSVDEWRGRLLVINFWATWCPPCRRELPVFKALQAEWGDRGVQFIGIALDTAELVRRYGAEEFGEAGFNYPQLAGQQDAISLGQRLGNRIGALPYTVVVDPRGRIVERIFGEWQRDEAEALFGQIL